MLFDVLLDVVVPVMLVAAAGGIVGRRFRFEAATLSNVVFWLFSPALVFTSMSHLALAGGDVVRVVGVAVVLFVLNAAISMAWSALRGHDAETRAVAGITAAIANQGNMGLPIVRLAFGARGLQVAVLVLVVGAVLASSLGITIGSLARRGGTRLEAFRAPLRYPSLYAAAFGVIVNLTGAHVPSQIGGPIDTLAQASIPCMLVLLGMQFQMPQLAHLEVPAAVSLNRLVLSPAIAWVLTVAVGLSGVARETTIALAGMPTAVLTTVIAAQLGLRVQLTVHVVVFSTLASMLSLTVLITLLR